MEDEQKVGVFRTSIYFWGFLSLAAGDSASKHWANERLAALEIHDMSSTTIPFLAACNVHKKRSPPYFQTNKCSSANPASSTHPASQTCSPVEVEVDVLDVAKLGKGLVQVLLLRLFMDARHEEHPPLHSWMRRRALDRLGRADWTALERITQAQRARITPPPPAPLPHANARPSHISADRAPMCLRASSRK